MNFLTAEWGNPQRTSGLDSMPADLNQWEASVTDLWAKTIEAQIAALPQDQRSMRDYAAALTAPVTPDEPITRRS